MIKYSVLDQIGQVPKNGAAVKQVFFTKKADALYAITPGWPGKKLLLRDIHVPNDSIVTMLGVPGSLKRSIHGNTLTITTPEFAPDSAPCRHAFTFKISGANLVGGP